MADMMGPYDRKSHVIDLDDISPDASDGDMAPSLFEEGDEATTPLLLGVPPTSPLEGDWLLPPMPSRMTRHATRSWVMTVRSVAQGIASGDIDPATGIGMDSTAPLDIMRKTPPRLVAMGFPDVPWKFLAFPLLSAISQTLSEQTYGMPLSVLEALPDMLGRPMAAMVPDGMNRGGSLAVFLEASAYTDVPIAVEVSRLVINDHTVMMVESVMARSGMSAMLKRAVQKGTLVMADAPAIRASQLAIGKRAPSIVNASNASRRNAPSWLGPARDIGIGTVSEAMGLVPSSHRTQADKTVPDMLADDSMSDSDGSMEAMAQEADEDWYPLGQGIDMEGPYSPGDDAVTARWVEHIAEAFDALATGREDSLPANVPVMSRTPDLLRDIGFPDVPWEHDKAHILRECSPMTDEHDIESHGIPSDVMVSLPELLCRPVAVYEPSTYPEHVNVVVDGATIYGHPITVCVSLEKAWSGILRPRIHISSIHGKGNALTKIDEAIGRGRLFYLDRPAVRSIAKRCSLTFTERMMQTDGEPDGMRHLVRQIEERHRQAEQRSIASAYEASAAAPSGSSISPNPDVDADGHITSKHGTIRLTVII